MFDRVLNTCLLPVKLETLWPLFMDRVQLSQGYRTTKRRLRAPGSFLLTSEDERMSLPWSNLAVLKPGLVDWESSAHVQFL